MITQPTKNELMFESLAARLPIFLNLPRPPIGNKVLLIKERGMFVLERGPAALMCLAVTHAGSGGIVAYDGVPDKHGQFPTPTEELFQVDLYSDETARRQALIDWESQKNGREIYYAMPAVLQCWSLQAGCAHGITILSSGELTCTPPVLTVVWMAFEAPQVQLARLKETARLK